MNRAYKSFLVVSFLSAILITSCSKSYNKYNNVTISQTADLTKLNSLFVSLRPVPQSITVTAGFLQTVYGIGGTKLTFYPNSFKDKKGNVITSGIIDIQLTEVYTLGDKIATRATTTSNGQLLTSGGQVLITATMNGNEVFANKYGIGFKQPGQSQKPMTLFYGDTNNPDSVVTWGVPSPNQVGVYVSGTTTYSDTNIVVFVNPNTGVVDTMTTHGPILDYYQFDSCTNFNWINCDYFYTSSAQLTDVTVFVPDTSFNSANSEVFVLFPTINAAAHMSLYTVATHSFDLPKGYYIPVGMPIDIVVATNKNGTYYYYQETGITTINGLFIFANMQQSTLAYITTQLQGL